MVEPDYRTGHTCTGIMWLCDTSMVSLVKPSVTKIQGIKKSQECCVKLPKRKKQKDLYNGNSKCSPGTWLCGSGQRRDQLKVAKKNICKCMDSFHVHGQIMLMFSVDHIL